MLEWIGALVVVICFSCSSLVVFAKQRSLKVHCRWWGESLIFSTRCLEQMTEQIIEPVVVVFVVVVVVAVILVVVVVCCEQSSLKRCCPWCSTWRQRESVKECGRHCHCSTTFSTRKTQSTSQVSWKTEMPMLDCTPRLRKKQSKLFLSKLCQIFTKFDNFWHEDGQDDEIIQGVLTFHLFWFMSMHYRVKQMFQIVA